MNIRHSGFNTILSFFILAIWLVPSVSMSKTLSVIYLHDPDISSCIDLQDGQKDTGTLKDLNSQLITCLQRDDMAESRIIVDKILKELNSSKDADKNTLASTYYLTGIFFLKSEITDKAIKYLNLAAAIKESRKEYDERYAKILYNLGVAYYAMGDFPDQKHFSAGSLEIEKKIYGESSPFLIKSCNLLALACVGLQEYEKSLEYSKFALNISRGDQGILDKTDLMSLYNNLGVTYIHLADYSKARVYLEKTETIYRDNHIPLNESYLSLFNNMAITYEFLGLSAKSNEYYAKGIDLADSFNSSQVYNFINSYAIALGHWGNNKKGEQLLYNAMARAKSKFGEDSPIYFHVLFNYAQYLRDYKIDNDKALDYYELCLGYLDKNSYNLQLKDPVYLGYALSLAEKGEYYEALGIIQSLLFPELKSGDQPEGLSEFGNPEITAIKADKVSLNFLQSKYMILWKIYTQTHDIKILETASSTATLIVSVLEKVRINISEEDSRLILGDRYRDSYIRAIRDFNLLYGQTGNPVYLDDAFEFCEKSKVAGLLTATRELNAAQFNIPVGLADLENRLKRNINNLNAKIDEAVINAGADTSMINEWKEGILKSSLVRDSLVSVFEKNYPGYYSFKYNTSVIKLTELPDLIGRNTTYVNYILSDTVLYIFVANRLKHQLLALPADSSLWADIKEFRGLLSMPSSSENAREAFENFQKTGYRLYLKLVEPIRPYLISGKLLISPDNVLSYIPFETIPTSPSSGKRIMYNQIPYLMNDFEISYTYSVTFTAESMKRKTRLTNNLIAFAPIYNEPIDIGTVLMNRQGVHGVLPDLPFARQEAEYVSSLTHGILYENDEAKANVFKNESGKYDIIHLAMHTILNDKDPMYSTLIFSADNDSTDNRYLKTYEVYSIPLRAKMVVLSSCNSGTGYMDSGEGILSLARGFMYSGSESVVMAMWEIEDRSGTEIVKSFYDNLRDGFSKSSSLRKARISYLKNADQLRAHPYFWSSLVVYGNNSPLYYPKYLYYLIALAGTILIILSAIYFWRRKNS